MLREKITKILDGGDIPDKRDKEFYIDQLESIFNSNLKEQREGIIDNLEVEHLKWHELINEECGGLGFCAGELILGILREKLATNTLEVKV